MVEQLVEGQAEQLISKTLALAQAGDVSCLRMMLDRIWPPRRGHPVKFDVPPLKTSTDILNAIASVWSAIAAGHLTPDEASALSLVAERSMAALSLGEILPRIEALEKREPKIGTDHSKTA